MGRGSSKSSSSSSGSSGGSSSYTEDNSHLAEQARTRAKIAEAASKERMQKAQLAHDKEMAVLANKNKKDQRDRIAANIKNLQAEVTTVETLLADGNKKLIDAGEAKAKFKAEKERLMGKIKDFSKYKSAQLQNYEVEIKLDLARTEYFHDRDEIEDAITKTGVHSSDVGKFLMLTHALTGATMSTQAEANRLDVALSTFGTIINNECQDKLVIDYYFNERNLKQFIPILSKQGFETLDQMICDDEKQFNKDILTTLDKGIQKQEKKQKVDATTKMKEYQEMEQKAQTKLSEIESKLNQFDDKTETKDQDQEKENEKQKLIGDQTEVNNKILSYQRLLQQQNDILQELTEKEQDRKQREEEQGDDEKTENDDEFLEIDKEGEELCIYLLEKWKLKQYWEKLEDEGWDDPDDWATLTVEDLENDIGITQKGRRNKFLRNAKKWKDMRDKKEKEKEEKEKQKREMKNIPKQKVFYYLTSMQQKEFKNICLRPQQTWKEYEIEQGGIVKKGLLALSPVLGEFFGRINEGVKQSAELLNYKNELTSAQLKAIGMQKQNDKKMKAIEFRKKDHDGRRLLVKNSECEIYSDSSKKWCKGKVINVKKDDEGTWLNVEYKINDELRTKQVQKYNNDIRPLQTIEQKDDDEKENDDDLSVAKTNSNPIVVQSGALITASIVSINVTDTLLKEFTVSPVTERGLTLAISVEDCCRHIITNQGEIRQSVFLAQEILKYKPANMNDEKTSQLWKAVDTGIVRIFGNALEMVKVAAQYFGFFLRFQNSFKFFISCYSDGQDASLFNSLARLKKDLREFNTFRESFANTVIQLNQTAMKCIGNCVKQQIGHLNWEKRQQSIEHTEKTYLAKQKLYNKRSLVLDKELDQIEEKKVLETSREARAIAEYNELQSRIAQGDAYRKQCLLQINDLQKIVI